MQLVETGINEKGESYIYSCSTPEKWNMAGHLITDLSFSKQNPSFTFEEKNLIQQAPEDFNLMPGQIRFFKTEIKPTHPQYQNLPPDNTIPLKKFFYHSTSTVDYVIVHKGPVTLIVEEETIELQSGDCVIQRGAAHAWHNYTNETMIIMGIMIGVETPSHYKSIKAVLPESEYIFSI